MAAITRGLGIVAARLNAQLVLRRLVYVGDGPHAEEAVRRRGRARFRQGMWSNAGHYGRTPARALAPSALVWLGLLLISFPLVSARLACVV